MSTVIPADCNSYFSPGTVCRHISICTKAATELSQGAETSSRIYLGEDTLCGWGMYHRFSLLTATDSRTDDVTLVMLQSCQADLVKDGGHRYFLMVLDDRDMPVSEHVVSVCLSACLSPSLSPASLLPYPLSLSFPIPCLSPSLSPASLLPYPLPLSFPILCLPPPHLSSTYYLPPCLLPPI